MQHYTAYTHVATNSTKCPRGNEAGDKFQGRTMSRLPEASLVSSELSAQQVTGPPCPDNSV